MKIYYRNNLISNIQNKDSVIILVIIIKSTEETDEEIHEIPPFSFIYVFVIQEPFLSLSTVHGPSSPTTMSYKVIHVLFFLIIQYLTTFA